MGENVSAQAPRLERRLGTLQATALNMANMVGVGPFFTIGLIVKELPGPQVMLGWGLGLIVVLADSMIWCELGAALPGSGGTYHYLKEVFRTFRFGRLLPFVFIWQFIFSGPLEVSTGCIGFVRYLHELWPESWGALAVVGGEGGDELTIRGKLAATALTALAVVFLYRKIGSIGKLTVGLWIGMLVTVLLAIAAAASLFEPARAFTVPAGALGGDRGFGVALGAALIIAIYDFLGYYDICFLGDEVRDPARTIPRAVVISALAVAAIYATMNIGVLGALPLEQVKSSPVVFTRLVEAAWGSWPAKLFTVLILWTAFASVFALLLGYSRIPFAAARDGYFFRAFADLHPTQGFPRVALLVLGAVTMAACWFPFKDVLDALVTLRILPQFVAQIVAVVLVRRARPDIHLPFRMWLYPLPCLVALIGWLFAFYSSGVSSKGFAVSYTLVVLTAGILAFFLYFRRRRTAEQP